MHYLVDVSNRIVGVDEGWDAGAAENSHDGSGPTSDKIIGHLLEDFLVGDATKMFVRAALDAARLQGQSRRLPYRCDSSHERRRFEMVISPQADGQVKVEHVLIESVPRSPCSTRTPRIGPRLRAGWRCSQCLFVRLAGSTEWTASDMDAGVLLAKDVCPSCVRLLFASGTPELSA
jgi:hypothetical protein